MIDTSSSKPAQFLKSLTLAQQATLSDAEALQYMAWSRDYEGGKKAIMDEGFEDDENILEVKIQVTTITLSRNPRRLYPPRSLLTPSWWLAILSVLRFAWSSEMIRQLLR